MKRTWIVLGVILGIIVIGAVGYLGFRSSEPKAQINQKIPATVNAKRCNVEQSVTAPGSVINFQETAVKMPFDGKLTEILVRPGDTVKKGQVLAKLNSTAQEEALAAAKFKLAELTSPEAIANAKLAVTSAQADEIKAQNGLYATLNWKNEALIKNHYANVVLAKQKLNQAQDIYDKARVGEYINNPEEAFIYKALLMPGRSTTLRSFT